MFKVELLLYFDIETIKKLLVIDYLILITKLY
jgi:hypothetical protein